jgi:uncharacterized membrane protein (Fun14 family)
MMTTPSETAAPPVATDWIFLARGLAGAIAGGIAGYFVFWLLTRSNLYGFMIPGAVLGIGAGWAARRRSQTLAIICGVLAIGLTLFAVWHVMYSKNHTFLDFLSKLHTHSPMRIVMMVLGPIMAYWFGQGR